MSMPPEMIAVGGLRWPEQCRGDTKSSAGQEAPGVNERGIGLEISRGKSLLIAANAFARRIEPGVAGDQRHPPMTKIEQMTDRDTHPFGVIGHNGISPIRLITIDQHDRNIEIAQEGLELTGDRRVRPHHHAVGLPPRQPAEQLPLTLLAAFRVGDEQREADLVQHVVRGFDEAGELRNVDLTQDAADRVGRPDAHALRHRVRRIAQIIDCALDLPADVGMDGGIGIEHPRHRAGRYARCGRHVADCQFASATCRLLFCHHHHRG
ncbi:hypothetical protein ACVWZM_005687 [Bradyrhizobium sp. USDA 4501]